MITEEAGFSLTQESSCPTMWSESGPIS